MKPPERPLKPEEPEGRIINDGIGPIWLVEFIKGLVKKWAK